MAAYEPSTRSCTRLTAWNTCVGIEFEARDRRLQLVRQHVDEQLGVGRRVEVAAVLVEQLRGELARVREVAVVHEHDAVGGVHVEGLGLLLVGRGALRRVAHVAEADLTEQRPHVAGAERLAHLAAGLVLVHDPAALGRRDAGRVLAAVLQKQKGVVDLLVGRPTAHHSDDSAHGCCLLRLVVSALCRSASCRLPAQRAAWSA